jgi:hypothetical protein
MLKADDNDPSKAVPPPAPGGNDGTEANEEPVADENNCAICMDEVKIAGVIPCGHNFCFDVR